jgi:hypothetical protein
MLSVTPERAGRSFPRRILFLSEVMSNGTIQLSVRFGYVMHYGRRLNKSSSGKNAAIKVRTRALFVRGGKPDGAPYWTGSPDVTNRNEVLEGADPEPHLVEVVYLGDGAMLHPLNPQAAAQSTYLEDARYPPAGTQCLMFETGRRFNLLLRYSRPVTKLAGARCGDRLYPISAFDAIPDVTMNVGDTIPVKAFAGLKIKWLPRAVYRDQANDPGEEHEFIYGEDYDAIRYGWTVARPGAPTAPNLGWKQDNAGNWVPSNRSFAQVRYIDNTKRFEAIGIVQSALTLTPGG